MKVRNEVNVRRKKHCLYTLKQKHQLFGLKCSADSVIFILVSYLDSVSN